MEERGYSVVGIFGGSTGTERRAALRHLGGREPSREEVRAAVDLLAANLPERLEGWKVDEQRLVQLRAAGSEKRRAEAAIPSTRELPQDLAQPVPLLDRVGHLRGTSPRPVAEVGADL